MKSLSKQISNVLLLLSVLVTLSINGCVSDADKGKPKNKTELRAIIDQAIAEHGNEVDLNFIDTSLITDMSELFFIDEINVSKNKNLLEEFYRFLNLEDEIQETYKLNAEQNFAIAEAREQIKNGDYLTNKEANQDMDECLSK